MNVAGGTHHAYSDKGEGFCLLNDVAIASHFLMSERNISKILVIDLDVHQGNGTAEIFAKEPKVFTFSMHGKENYPLHKEISDLDIELPTYTTDDTYLNLLYDTLPRLIQQVQPQFLFFISGWIFWLLTSSESCRLVWKLVNVEMSLYLNRRKKRDCL
jgi:acetoin utilization deacetylase AcuC-like enzyme